MRYRRARHSAGLSLIELLIVVAILIVVAGLAMPMLGQTTTDRLAAAARLLAADLDFARVESIAHGDNPRVVVFNTATQSWHIAAASDPTTPITNPVGNIPYSTTFGVGRAAQLAGVTIQSVTVGGDNQLGFGIYGQLDQTTTAAITLACNSRTVTISIDPISGEPSIGAVN